MFHQEQKNTNLLISPHYYKSVVIIIPIENFSSSFLFESFKDHSDIRTAGQVLSVVQLLLVLIVITPFLFSGHQIISDQWMLVLLF